MDAEAALHRAGGPALVAFTRGLVTLAEESLGALTAGYVVGSVAAGDALPVVSDLDVLLVTDEDHSDAHRLAAGGRLADAAADVPLRGVELVLYARQVLAAPRHPLTYLLNVNAGPAMERRVATGGDPAFWFLLDLDAAVDMALQLFGPRNGFTIGRPPEADVRLALGEALRWHLGAHPGSPDAVLNACRAWHWTARGTWISKSAAGQWAVDHGGPSVIAAALRARAAGEDGEVLNAHAAVAFQGDVLRLVSPA